MISEGREFESPRGLFSFYLTFYKYLHMVELIFADIVLRMIVATIIGALIGIERELHGISAGMRTHALVCLGAAMFTLISIQISIIDSRVDIARVAAGVVTGVGFLGAGAIFFDKKNLHGFTTAANIWVVASLGMMIGIGEVFVSVIAAGLVLALLVAGKIFEIKVIRKREKKWGIFKI